MGEKIAQAAQQFGLIEEFELAREVSGAGPRLAAMREAAAAVRERLLAAPSALCVRTLPIVGVAYPTKYAFRGAALSPAPFIHFTHRCLLVQFKQHGALKTLLFNPTDYDRSRATPYYAELIRRFGTTASEMLARKYDPLEAQLAALGLGPSDIDYIAFDHFHTQDLRRQLGTTDGQFAPRFPRALLLAPASEWLDWDDLHPMQRAWFVPDGKTGVIEDRVLLTQADMVLGDGVMLVRTPGHTSGNQTLFVKTDSGIWGCSENGVSADNWSPRVSRIPGVALEAMHTNVDFVLNANTIEGGAEQYTSMAVEKAMVDRVKGNEDFCQMLPSSELESVLYAPLLKPTVRHGGITHGAVQQKIVRGLSSRTPKDRRAKSQALDAEQQIAAEHEVETELEVGTEHEVDAEDR